MSADPFAAPLTEPRGLLTIAEAARYCGIGYKTALHFANSVWPVVRVGKQGLRVSRLGLDAWITAEAAPLQPPTFVPLPPRQRAR